MDELFVEAFCKAVEEVEGDPNIKQNAAVYKPQQVAAVMSAKLQTRLATSYHAPVIARKLLENIVLENYQ